MDAVDLTLRNNTYTLLVRLGRGPTAAEVATETGMAETAVQAGWKRLHEQHAIVLGSDDEIRMANPFHRVEAAGRSWYAKCAWDAFGVCAALDADGHIETTCPDCGEQLVVEVRDGRPDDERLVFHSLVDAGHWWDDIVFT